MRDTINKAIQWAGVSTCYVACRGVRGATILMYHSVPGALERQWIDPENATPADIFEGQMQYLRRRRNVISMTELVDAIVEQRSLPSGTVVLTFDDGYRDNLLVAAPILKRLNLPAMLYLATEYVNKGLSPWIDHLYQLFCTRTKNTLVVDEIPWPFDLSRRDQCAIAYRFVRERLITSDLDRRERLLTDFEKQLCCKANPPRLTLTWDEVRQLTKEFPQLEIGAHTATHIDLRTHAGATVTEIGRCVADIQRELGTPPSHFSFPYGRYCDESRNAVRQHGFLSAVVAGDNPLIQSTTDRFALVRIAAPASQALLSFYTSGAYPDVSRALLGSA